MVNGPLKPGSIWRAKNRFATIDEIRIIDETENPRVWLVEWIQAGRELRMSAESILSGYTSVAEATLKPTRSTAPPLR